MTNHLVLPAIKVAEAAGIEPTQPIKAGYDLANHHIPALSYLRYGPPGEFRNLDLSFIKQVLFL
jgi:hypothetical protein